MILSVITTLAILAPTGGTETPEKPEACDVKCKEKRLYRKARKATPREPLPYYVTDCESGGRLHAQNPTSPAGGRYQIMPETWSANLPSRRFIRIAGGNKGPRWSSRLLQDKVADTIRDDQGLAPWSCS